jgi:hypothetical protein
MARPSFAPRHGPRASENKMGLAHFF